LIEKNVIGFGTIMFELSRKHLQICEIIFYASQIADCVDFFAL